MSTRQAAAQDQAQRFSFAQLWAGALDVLLRILPMVLLAILALLSHWLIRNAPEPLPEVRDKPASSKPDYLMHDFVTTRYDEQGAVRARLTGQQMRHLPDRDIFEVDVPVHEQWDTSGRLTRSSARKGISNADGTEIQLLTQVVVTRAALDASQPDDAPDLRIASEFLHLKSRIEELSTHLPVVIERGRDRFEANGMTYDNLSQNMVMTGAVKGRFAPKKAPAPAPVERALPKKKAPKKGP